MYHLLFPPTAYSFCWASQTRMKIFHKICEVVLSTKRQVFVHHWIKLSIALGQCRIQQFFGGASFSASVARRKTVVQLGSLVGHCKPFPMGSSSEAPENCGYFFILNSSKQCFCGSATTNGDKSLHQKSREI